MSDEEYITRLEACVIAFAHAADLVSREANIVQPFLSVFREHGAVIAAVAAPEKVEGLVLLRQMQRQK